MPFFAHQKIVIASLVFTLPYATSALAACPISITTAISECSTSGSPAVVITNTGSVSTAIKDAVNYSGNNSGSLVNNGFISANVSVANTYDFWTGTNTMTEAAGILSSSLQGYVKNAGTIFSYAIGNQGGAYSSGINANGNLVGVLENVGAITAYSESKVTGHGAVAQGIRFNGYLQNIVNQFGTISADARGGNAEAYGVYINGDLLGSLATTGSMTSVAHAKQGNSLVNGGWAAGVDTNGNLIGSLNNGSAIAVSVSAEKGQSIGTGLRVNGYLQGVISNNNTINVSSSALTGDAHGYAAGISVNGDLTGVIQNNGAISVTATGNSSAYGIDISGGISASHVLNNAGSIAVTNGNIHEAAIGLNVNYLNGTLNNSGSIAATKAISVNYGGTGVFNNTGSIKGDVKLAGKITTNNAGAIDGNINVDNGTLNLGNGSNITGTISGAGMSALNVNGDVRVAKGVNVNSLNVSNGSKLTIDQATVSASSVVVNGQLLNNGVLGHGAGTITVTGGIGGSGLFDSQTILKDGAHLAAGNSPGVATFSHGLTFESGSVIDFDLGSSSDSILVKGGMFAVANAPQSIKINFIFGEGFLTNTEYTLVDWSGAVASSLNINSFYTTNAVAAFRIDGSALKVNISSVPLPAASWLFGAGLLSLTGLSRHKKTKSS